MRPIIKNESHGYVKPDGNPMTGGKWYSITYLAHKNITIASLTDDPAVRAWLTERNGGNPSFVMDAYICYGKDNATNYEGYEMDEYFAGRITKDIADCPLLNDETRLALWDKLDEIANDPDGYTAYES